MLAGSCSRRDSCFSELSRAGSISQKPFPFCRGRWVAARKQRFPGIRGAGLGDLAPAAGKSSRRKETGCSTSQRGSERGRRLIKPPALVGEAASAAKCVVFFYAVALVQFPCGPGRTLAAFALAVPSGGRGENPQHRQLLPIRKPQEPLQLLPLLSGMLPLLGGLWGGPQGFPTSATREWSAKALVTVACPWARQGTANPAGFRECWDL